MAIAYNNPKIVTDGLMLYFDPSNTKCSGMIRNFFTAPEDFSNAAWVKSSVIVETNSSVLAPDGTATADKLVLTGLANSIKRISQGVITGKTISVYAKKAELDYVSVGKSNGGGLWTWVSFSLVTGTFHSVGVASTSELPTEYGIESAGGGWFRVWASFAEAASGNGAYIACSSDGNPVYGASRTNAGDNVSGIYIWGAQLEPGLKVSKYFPVSVGLSANTLYDLSANYSNGTIQGGATYNVACLELDGTDDYINVPVAQYNTITVSMFVRATVLTASNQGLFSITPVSTSTKVVGGWVTAAGNIWGRVIANGVQSNLPQSSSTLNLNTWTYLAFVADGTTYKVLRNDEPTPITSVAYTGNLDAYTQLTIGVQGTEYFTGQVGLFQLYNRALSGSEVMQNYNALRMRYGV